MSTLAKHPQCNPACRACHYKDLEYPEQLARKRKWAEEQLGTWKPVLRDILPSPSEEHIGYRSKSWLRSHFEDGQLSFGMYRAIQLDGKWEKEFVSWNYCPLHSQAIQDTIAKLRKALPRRFAEESLWGVWLGEPHVVIVARTPDQEMLKALDWSSIIAPPIDRVWFHVTSQVGRQIFGRGEIIQIAGARSEPERVHPVRAFRQIAKSLLGQARELAVHSLLQGDPAMVLDLYCGTGDLSLLLPANVGWLGIEMSKEAVGFAQNLRPVERGGHSAFVGAVEDRLRDTRVVEKIEKPYALFLNPPRSGLTLDAISAVTSLIRSRTPTSIAYLSCSASSLARDLRVFEKQGYRVKLLQPYDFFPQTEHFETLAVLAPDLRS